jgi:hypothetical protein
MPMASGHGTAKPVRQHGSEQTPASPTIQCTGQDRPYRQQGGVTPYEGASCET